MDYGQLQARNMGVAIPRPAILIPPQRTNPIIKELSTHAFTKTGLHKKLLLFFAPRPPLPYLPPITKKKVFINLN